MTITRTALILVVWLLHAATAHTQTVLTQPTTGVTVTWGPGTPGTNPVTRYEVRLRTADSWASVTPTEYPLGDLPVGSYSAQVRACSSDGCGDPSAALAFSVQAQPAPPPPPPPPPPPAAVLPGPPQNLQLVTATTPPPPPPPSGSAFYVDASCQFDGNGRADQCAASAGAPGAWNGTVSADSGGVQNCMNTLVAGETCYIKNGTYRTTWRGGDYRVTGGFHPTHSGTATSKITYKAYPGHHPILINCTDGNVRECDHQTIGANNQSHIVYDGLTIIGALYLLRSHPGPMNVGLEVKNCDISVGWFGDGNWAGLYIEWADGAWVHHNRFHDIAPTPEVIQTGSGIKHYASINTIVEYNTFENITIRANGIDAKTDAINQTFRYNLFREIRGNGIGFNNGSPNFLPDPGSGKIYGNVFYHVTTGITIYRNISSLDIYNNTFYDIGEMYYQANDNMGTVIFRQWNNLFNVLNSTGEGKITNFYGPSAPAMSDYNVWPAGRFSYAGTLYSSLADLQTRRGIDTHSQVLTCPVVAAGTDFHLPAGSACLTFGRVGGVTSGAPVQVGAYGAAQCVGHLCQQ